MKRKSLSPIEWALAALIFLLPLLLFYITSSECLMFDDAGEFALAIKQAGIAHPPGTPAYILFGALWERLATMMGFGVIGSITLFSSFCVSFASLLLFFTFRKILLHLEKEQYQPFKNGLIAFFSASVFAFGATAWNYANTIEVYSFQELAMAVLFFGLVHYHFNRTFMSLAVAAFGIGLGISNHHLTMVLFLPFVPFFFFDYLFLVPEITSSKKKIVRPSQFSLYKKAFLSKPFWQLAGMAFFVSFLCYGWMFIRAQQEFPFMFGKPDTLSGLLYHIRGASYSKNLTTTTAHLIGLRIPYFFRLTFFHFLLFLPFLILGLVYLLRSKRRTLFIIVLFYFLFLLTYQIFNNQWANTDAYMLLPFMMLVVAVFYCIYFYFDRWKLKFILPLLLAANIAYNFPHMDRRTYPVSRDLMHILDISCPKNSIVMISDWSTVIQYYYFRLVENFRPDLVVINYDIKFTHYRILPLMYPEFYKKIQPEYDHLIDEMRKEHPEEVSNTGCNLTTDVLMDAFRRVVQKMETLAAEENVPFMTDPKAHIFYIQQHFYSDKRNISGGYVSTLPGDSACEAEFLSLNFPFLKSKLLIEDGGSLDKLEDFHAIMDYHIMYYQSNRDTFRMEQSKVALEKILAIQREMRKSMSFAYKLK